MHAENNNNTHTCNKFQISFELKHKALSVDVCRMMPTHTAVYATSKRMRSHEHYQHMRMTSCYLKDGVFTEIDKAIQFSFISLLINDIVEEGTFRLLQGAT